MRKPFAVTSNRTSVFVNHLFSWSVIGAALICLAVPARGQTTNLVAAYGFDEGAGTTVTDSSGNGNNGTISGATWTTSGKYGNALVFNGTGALVTINNSASLQLSTAMTLEAWVNPSVVSNLWGDIIYKGNDDYYLEGTSGNGGVPAIGGTFGGSDVVLNGSGALAANTWSYLAATYDGTTTRLYVNGVQVASQAQTGPITTSTDPLQIGGDSLYSQFFQGTIDEVRIYDVALTAAQIQSDMNTPVPPDTQPPSAPTNLVATAVGGTQIELNWMASTDNIGVTGYLLERQDPGNTNFAQIATVAGTNYLDIDLMGPTNYSYRVRATDALGNVSAYSPVASATTLPGAVASDDFNRPNGPLGSNWSKPIISTNNLVVTNDQVGVDVENSHNYAFWSATNFDDDQYSQAQITRLGAWTGVILRADSVQDRFYMGFVFAPNDYRIYSRWDGAYYSLATGSSVTWQAGDVLRLEVRGSADPITIIMYRNGKPVLSWVSTGSGMDKTGGNPGLGIYSPAGMGLMMDNWEGGNLPPDTQPPSAPTNLVAGALTANQIALSWQASTDNVGVLEYYVERSQGVGSTTFTQVGTATGTNYNDTGLAMSSTYNYRVRATDAAGNLSGYSSVATATTPSAGSGLVAAYGFNEGTGTTVADTSGNGNNGTISGATWTTSGKYGNALVFSGTGALVTVNNSASLQLSTVMTLEAWVNPSVVSNAWEDVIYKGNDNYYLEGTSGNGKVPVVGGTFGSSDVVLDGTVALPANTWSYLAATYDGATTRLYVNGVQVASQAQTGPIVTSTDPLQIGGDTLYSQYFRGKIDEVRIYDVALTAAQIQTDMNTPVAAIAPFQISSIVQQGNDMLITWTTVGGKTNVLQAANGTASGSFSNNFADIFTVTNIVSTVTNYLDAGAATNFPARYYRVRLLP